MHPASFRPLPDGPLYLVGIGGAGMSALAWTLARRGRAVSGADPAIAPEVRARLEAIGVRVFTHHDPRQIPAAAVAVVATDAVPADHAELCEARRRGLPLFRRPEALATIVNSAKTSLCIAGTHGKTTTTGMIASILQGAGREPTVLVGGDLAFLEGGNACAGDPDLVVAEACEAYGGLDALRPTVALITNIEPDHLDFHGTPEAFVDAFRRFFRRAGRVVACCEDPTTAAVADEAAADEVGVVRYGAGDLPASVRLRVPGRHNVQNAAGAWMAAALCGVSPEDIRRGLETFAGVGRRFEVLRECSGITVVDDYAHHPTEIRATVEAARQVYPGRRLVVAFQPHLPSRTRDFLDAFAAALAESADAVYLTEIYRAREPESPGLAAELARRVGERGVAVRFVPDRLALAERLATELQRGDVALLLGAGNIREAAERLVRRLCANGSGGADEEGERNRA